MKESDHKILRALTGAFLLLVFAGSVVSQTTGKISGKVTDVATSQPLIGANVIIDGTSMGAATDQNGDFFIINVQPGAYTVKSMMMGFETIIVKDVRVSVNRTQYLEFKMRQTVIEGQEVIVEAKRVTIRKDQTSTVKNVSASQMEVMPVEDVAGILSMQAGVVRGHFRGGRMDEVSYLVDGVQVDENFGGGGRSVDLEVEAIEDLEVITGTFNSEYGKAMSGIVNAVTKVGSNQFHGSISGALGNYYTSHSDIFIGLKAGDVARNQDYKFTLSGPIIKNRGFFFANYRYQDNKNHLNGIRRFRVSDFSYFASDDSAQWYSEHTGDGSYVAMNRSLNKSFVGKITLNLVKNFRLNFMYTNNNDEWHNYDHQFKYNPDGMAADYRNSNLYALNINHMLNRSLFYEFKLSAIDNTYGHYVYKNPYSAGYVHEGYSMIDGPGFWTGGNQKSYTKRVMKDLSMKFDLTWQATNRHGFKTGFEMTDYSIDNQEYSIRNIYEGTPESDLFELVVEGDRMKLKFLNYEPSLQPDSSEYADVYLVKPIEYSAYLQDKMEFDDMVINLGVRYDYFNPKTVYPTQLRNPANQLDFPNNPEKISTYPDTDPKTQISPRLGLSYQLGKAAILHFSYGHFFQMPPMYAMYSNHAFTISPTDYQTVNGNARVKAEKTVSYEVGLWQEVATGLNVDVALFYRDIYDLLSTKIISTYNQIEYGLYTNKDYGNARGLELKIDFSRGDVMFNMNYTLQYTRGNADNPTQTFTRAGNSMDPINRLIPMSWDQRHTFNATVGYNTRVYGATMTGYYNSGTPYTWQPIAESALQRVNLFPNNAWQPAIFSFDLNGYYNIRITKHVNAQLTLTVYNLLDRLNAAYVNAQTGMPYTAIVRANDIASHRSDFNDYYDRIHNPSMYTTPRILKLGLGINF
ncbi:MAG: TonB-dependent receptor [Candidatus Neomarinimicrobiota bacterium]